MKNLKIIVSQTVDMILFISCCQCKTFQVNLFALFTISYGKAQHYYTLYRPGVVPPYTPYNTPQNIPHHYSPEARIDYVKPVPYHNE